MASPPAPPPPTVRRRRATALAAGIVALGAAAAGAVLATRARRRRGHPPRPAAGVSIPHTGRVRRNARIARLGARTGGAYALHTARRTFASSARREELDRTHELRTAEQVAAELGQMKGALMKVGQLASFLDQGLPEPFRVALAQLQQDAPPMAPGLAAEVVATELGDAPEAVFLEWDPEPVAAASIGQVHRAITREGRAVAVKVQYPGVADAMRADLDNFDLVVRAMGLTFPGLDTGPVVEEIRARVAEELDYVVEAANQRLFADAYRDHPFIHVPDVLERYSTARVLTTDLAEGARFAEVQAWSRDERDLAGETIFRFVFSGLYRLHAFNGDPHPGNYLFRPGGRVSFLDFGFVKRFTADEVGVLADLTVAMVDERDPARFREIMERAGLLRAGALVSDALVADFFGHFWGLVRDDRVVEVGGGDADETVRRYFALDGPYGDVLRAANLPPAFVVVQRINLGMFSVLAALGSRANWRRISDEIWPWVEGPPSTPLGALEHSWRLRRAAGAKGGPPDGPEAGSGAR